MKHEVILFSEKEEDTMALGYVIGQHAEDNLFIALSGNLGVGKTHFTQGLAKGMNIQDGVSSPTFTLMNYYEGRLPLKHFDFYRLNHEEEAYNIGWDEYSQGGVTIVEWADMFPSLIPQGSVRIRIEYVSLTERKILISWDEVTPTSLVKEICDYVACH